ncbi:hypothetical protein Nham_1046 [Nitrobacter hamburgensis X14]|uniref:Uncharacterized protein n=1 Tax=Nitrobacter hamburgensis (strain DSM 10229 / NCIMB 13809 / X14) TaxID=323097 RepID=Q1QPF3_NITHX|nr:hypothetical protein Nham_1046 [Nitrobacter hamburgensis X14]
MTRRRKGATWRGSVLCPRAPCHGVARVCRIDQQHDPVVRFYHLRPVSAGALANVRIKGPLAKIGFGATRREPSSDLGIGRVQVPLRERKERVPAGLWARLWSFANHHMSAVGPRK